MVEGLREKAKTIVAMELVYPSAHAFPRYMHVAVPEDAMGAPAPPRSTTGTGTARSMTRRGGPQR